MQEYIKRMITEKEELQGRIKKAEKAIEKPPFGIDKTGLLLLAEQVNAMKNYLSCLVARIEYEQGK